MLKRVSTVLLTILLLDLFNMTLDKIIRFVASTGF